MEEDICELLWAEIPLKNSGSYFLGVFYRPPSSDMNYQEGLKRSLEKVAVVSDHTNIVLLGDFNFPDIDWDLICPSQPNVLSDYFCDNIVNFYGFSQLIDEPTRQDAILDLVISNRPAITIGYKSMVRPIVEYACPVWNPHQQYLSDKLERVQRNASRWILGSSIDYSERLEYLGWPTLNSRREFLSLVQLFKFINGFSRVDLCNYLTFSNSRTRSTNNVKIWTPYARTNILKNSFWYKYIKIWNDLPNDIISSSSASKLKKRNERTHF